MSLEEQQLLNSWTKDSNDDILNTLILSTNANSTTIEGEGVKIGNC